MTPLLNQVQIVIKILIFLKTQIYNICTPKLKISVTRTKLRFVSIPRNGEQIIF